MKALTHRCPKEWKEARLYLLADWHWGSPQCLKPEIRRLVKTIADDPRGLWIGCGDLAENALLSSLGDIYNQEVSPQHQLAQLALLLEPIADQCIAMVGGNHGRRTSKAAGIDVDHVLAALLRKASLADDWGIYAGATALVDLYLGNQEKRDSITRWTLYVHHGVGGGRTKGAKVTAMARGNEVVEGADVYIAAHHHADNSHTDVIKFSSPSRVGGDSSIRTRLRHYTSCLSALGYDESYAEVKQLPPATPGYVVLTLGARRHHRNDDRSEDYKVKPFHRDAVHW